MFKWGSYIIHIEFSKYFYSSPKDLKMAWVYPWGCTKWFFEDMNRNVIIIFTYFDLIHFFLFIVLCVSQAFIMYQYGSKCVYFAVNKYMFIWECIQTCLLIGMCNKILKCVKAMLCRGRVSIFPFQVSPLCGALRVCVPPATSLCWLYSFSLLSCVQRLPKEEKESDMLWLLVSWILGFGVLVPLVPWPFLLVRLGYPGHSHEPSSLKV